MNRLWRLSVGPIGVNCYIVCSGSQVCIVDPGYGAQTIADRLEALNLSPTLVVLTHGHLDHSAAIPDLFMLTGKELPIAIHADDACYLGPEGEETNRRLFEAIRAGGFFRSMWKPLPPPAILLRDGDMLPGTSIQVIHTPGHSRGSICLYVADLEAGMLSGNARACLLTGDTLFRDGVGRTDTPDADHMQLEASLKKLAHFPPETPVLPGHGPETVIGRELHAPMRR